ncbi:MAG: UPF0149 family protein [Ottowia sp.]|uniref:UPF0149 family protein n=1 Tax=Ottowia sp. TaxID=1898956 RepID=UPI003C719873
MSSIPTSDSSHGTDEPDDAALATIEALDDVLDELAEHHETLPSWEYCEGAMTALLCTRRPVPEAEWLPRLLDLEADTLDAATGFASEAQRTRFLMNWLARESQIRQALESPVESLDDPQALDPAIMDLRGLYASQPAEGEAFKLDEGESLPAFATPWAQGFMSVVELWEEDWAPPRDKEIAANMADALECIEALCADDTDPPTLNLYDGDGPPSVSEQRMEAFGEAMWAVYDLYTIAKSLGPRIDPVRNDAKVGRNDPCPCGSGKKYKKCCGA